jgi:hypothetical protein
MLTTLDYKHISYDYVSDGDYENREDFINSYECNHRVADVGHYSFGEKYFFSHEGGWVYDKYIDVKENIDAELKLKCPEYLEEIEDLRENRGRESGADAHRKGLLKDAVALARSITIRDSKMSEQQQREFIHSAAKHFIQEADYLT